MGYYAHPYIHTNLVSYYNECVHLNPLVLPVFCRVSAPIISIGWQNTWDFRYSCARCESEFAPVG